MPSVEGTEVANSCAVDACAVLTLKPRTDLVFAARGRPREVVRRGCRGVRGLERRSRTRWNGLRCRPRAALPTVLSCRGIAAFAPKRTPLKVSDSFTLVFGPGQV